MTLNRSNSRMLMVILSVAAIAASGAAGSTPGKLRPHESGHLNLARSGHYNLAATTKKLTIRFMSKYVGLPTVDMSSHVGILITWAPTRATMQFYWVWRCGACRHCGDQQVRGHPIMQHFNASTDWAYLSTGRGFRSESGWRSLKKTKDWENGVQQSGR